MAEVVYPSYPILGGNNTYLNDPLRYGIVRLSSTRWALAVSQLNPDYTSVLFLDWDGVTNTFTTSDWQVVTTAVGTCRLAALDDSTLVLAIDTQTSTDNFKLMLLSIDPSDKITIDDEFEQTLEDIELQNFYIFGYQNWVAFFGLRTPGSSRVIQLNTYNITGGTISVGTTYNEFGGGPNPSRFLYARESDIVPGKWFITGKFYNTGHIVGDVENGNRSIYVDNIPESISTSGYIPVIIDRNTTDIFGVHNNIIHQWTSPTNKLPDFGFGSSAGNVMDILSIDENTVVLITTANIKTFHVDSTQLILPSENNVAHGITPTPSGGVIHYPKTYKLSDTKLLMIYWNISASAFEHKVIDVLI